VDAAEIDRQVERILANPLFAQSARLSALLRFVVKMSQSGRTDSLKEYSLGVEVFERGADFDPRIDNIVRIQAAKLRSRLVEYYAGDGAGDTVIISIPKGSYAPEIRQAAAKAGTENTSRSRIVVLPFVNMSSDIENEYFSDGLTEELINRLACVPELQVVARTSAFSFKGRNEDVRQVGAKLNVTTILEGSVRKAGGQLRVTAQLIDVASGFHLFSKTYQREYKDIFDLQDELAQAVASEVAPQSVRPSLPQETRTENLHAYNAYLRGMYVMGSEFVDLRQCIDYFEEAIGYSPDYAPAWAGKAHGYVLMAWFYRAPDHEAMQLARNAATKALELEPESAMALTSVASIECAIEWRWGEAEEKFLRAIELQPSLSVSYVAYAFWCLLPQLRFDEAEDLIQRGLVQDPFNPLMHAIAIYIFGRARQFEKADRQGALVTNLAPNYAPIPACVGCAYEWSGHVDRAIPKYRLASQLALKAGFPFSCLGHALAKIGETAEARTILDELLQAEPQSPADIARAYLGFGEDDECVRRLQVAAERRSVYLLRVPGDPRFDRLLTHPGYQAVLRTMGLPLTASALAGG
jgi:serine/threonine-protein kinase